MNKLNVWWGLIFVGFVAWACGSEEKAPGWKTGFVDYPTDEASGIKEVTLLDDASKLSLEPGSHEFWNFFCF